MTVSQREPWKVSLHGGHSSAFCDHAHNTLDEMLEAAVAFGYQTFGVSEHAPRAEARFLYAEEIAMGWDIDKLSADFEAYAVAIRAAAARFADRLEVLCGFEIEVVPRDRYVHLMRGHRERHSFDFIVGSVHHVEEMQLDGRIEEFTEALEVLGGIENLAVRYYETVAEMVESMKPEVVGHLDLVRRNAPPDAVLDSPRIRRAAGEALEAIRRYGAILDVNTAGYRKGLGSPYPSPWLVKLAWDMGIGFCFGDDSHSIDQVGFGVDNARTYLLENGVQHITALTRRDGAIAKITVPLD